MIEVNNLTFAFDNRKKLFENISFSLTKGETLCVLGPNGVGKTSLLKTLSGIYCPISGTCEIAMVGNRIARLAYVPQAKRIHFSYNVLDFISFGLISFNKMNPSVMRECDEKSKKILEILDASHLSKKDINQISGGELQLCYIAKALISDPDVLLLDEPESNLDFKNQNKIIKVLFKLSKEKNVTVILNTHFIAHAHHLADKCLLMSKEEYFFGEKESVLTENRLSSYFNVCVKKCYFEENDAPITSFIIPIE